MEYLIVLAVLVTIGFAAEIKWWIYPTVYSVWKRQRALRQLEETLLKDVS